MIIIIIIYIRGEATFSKILFLLQKDELVLKIGNVFVRELCAVVWRLTMALATIPHVSFMDFLFSHNTHAAPQAQIQTQPPSPPNRSTIFI